MIQNTALTKPEVQPVSKPKKLIKDELESDRFRIAVQKSLPKHLTPDRFVRVAINAITRTPALATCDQETFFGALMTLSQLGLEPDGRRAHLIPFWNSKRSCNECQLIIDYKGLAELAQRSGQLAKPPLACIVCENDEFSWENGAIRHKIDFRSPRGPMFAVYSMVETKFGGIHVEVMTREEVEKIRSRSKSKDKGPWVTDYDEMAKKTVFRRQSKMLVLSPEFMDAVEADDDANFDIKLANVADVKTAPIFADRRAQKIEPPAQEAEPQASDDEVPMEFRQRETKPEQPAQAPATPLVKEEPKKTAKAPTESLFPTEPNTLETAMITGGVTFDEFRTWAEDQGYDNIKDKTTFAEISKRQVELLTKAAASIIEEIVKNRGAK